MQMRFLERSEQREKTSLQICFTLGGKLHFIRKSKRALLQATCDCLLAPYCAGNTGTAAGDCCPHRCGQKVTVHSQALKFRLQFRLKGSLLVDTTSPDESTDPYHKQTIQPPKYLKAYVYSDSWLGQWVTSTGLTGTKSKVLTSFPGKFPSQSSWWLPSLPPAATLYHFSKWHQLRNFFLKVSRIYCTR